MRKFWFPNLIVFISNACIMIIELVAGRIMAPHMGVSLYTWTSIIGVILAGISLGNYLGGKVADRFASREVLGLIFMAAGLATLSVLAIEQLLSRAMNPSEIPLVLRILTFTTLVFFLPGCILGMVSPMVVKLTLEDLGRVGNTVGKIYASSALGSIVGTFATGFFLISWFTTRTIVWSVSALLILMGLAFVSRRAIKRGILILPLVFLVGLVLLSRRGHLASACTKETNYYCIKVHNETLGGSAANEKEIVVKVLTLDRLVHSYTSLDDPTRLIYDYERVYADVVSATFPLGSAPRVFFIGGGGYTFPRYMEHIYPGSLLEVAEIDPGVTRTAYELLGLSPTTTVVSHNQDARIYINQLPPKPRYDLVIGDAFNDFSVPYHLTTLEFSQRVRSLLTDEGYYMVNIVDGRHALFLRSYVKTLQLAFHYVYLIPTSTSWRETVRSTFVIIASNHPLELPELGVTGTLRAYVVPAELAEFLAERPAAILRDSYVPTDNLLAPVFSESAR